MGSAAPAAAAGPTESPEALGDPIVDADAVFAARRAATWTQGDTRMILLDDDVRFTLGVFGFRANRAVIRIDTQRFPGRNVHHLTLYLQDARSARGVGRVGAYGDRLLVNASTTGRPQLQTDLLRELEAAPDDPLVRQAEGRVERLQTALARPVIDLGETPTYDPAEDAERQARRRQIAAANRIGEIRILDEEAEEATRGATAGTGGTDADPRQTPAGILPTRGVLNFNADRVVFERANDQRDAALMLIGNVRLFYTDYDQDRSMSLVAQRVVVFLGSDEGGDNADAAIVGQQVAASKVTGVYLEDNAIITDGQYTVRAPRVFYNLQDNRAVLLEAVMFTDDIQRKVPLYLRADVMRQTSADTFEAENARFTTSEFAEPHFSIGAKRVTVDRSPDPAGQPRNLITAEGTSLQWYDMPVTILPKVQGRPGDVPLRGVSVGSDNNGVRIETAWDLYALAGRRAPEEVEATGNLDYRGEHGVAVGLDVNYQFPEFYGSVEGYFLPLDNGEEDIAGRTVIDQDEEQRGFIHLQHRQYLPYDIEMSLEVAHVSDETFLEEFFRSEAYDAKEYETSLYLKKQENEWALDLWARHDLDDFTPQLTTLQAPGYTVARGPELRYFRTGTPLFEGRANWYTENRAGRVKLLIGEDRPIDRGFSNADSLRFFGIPNTTAFDDAADAAGLPSGWVSRADSRHELEMPLDFGTLDVTPYAVGRVTAWDSDFEEFNGDNDDNVRFQGGGGIRTRTEFSRTFADVHNDLLDVHQLRHIVEPIADVFWHGQTIDPSDLPVYDPEVEGISEGGGVRLGLVNTLQTKRGGPGRWRSVDWLRLRTDLILRSDDTDTEADLAQYFSYRPEYSIGGDHAYAEVLWMVTQSVALVGDITYDLEEDHAARWRTALSIDHGERLRSNVSYQEVDVLDSRLLAYGFNYALTTKYGMGFRHTIDLAESETRGLAVTLDRDLPRWRLRAVAEYDEIDDEAIVGVILVPVGIDLDASPVSLLSLR